MNNLFLNRYPYTDFHELNLSWLIQVISEVQKTLDDFVAINSLKYADPIQWNITTQYEKNTIVIDPVSGVAYISVQPVPSGVALTNTDYWTVVFDLGSFVVRAAKNFTDRYEEETTLTATFPSNVDDWLVWGDVLYEVISPIVAGDQYVVDSNIKHFTMEDIYNEIIININTVDNNLKGSIGVNELDSTVATQNFGAGVLAWVFGQLYMTLTPINTGDTFTPGTNITPVRVNDFVNDRVDNAENRVHGSIGVNELDSTVATQNFGAGVLVWVGGQLYMTLTPINAGDTFTPGTNITPVTVNDFINDRVDNAENRLRGSIGVNELDSTVATQNFNTGVLVWVGGQLYMTLTPINAGDTFTPGTNITPVRVDDYVLNFINAINTKLLLTNAGANNQKYLTVGASNCNFTKITDAIAYAENYCTPTDRVTIFILGGIYTDEITLLPNKGVDLIGIGDVQIKTNSAYPNSPLYFAGSMTCQNIQFINQNPNGDAYAVHYEAQAAPLTIGNQIRFYNCTFGSAGHAALGAGFGDGDDVTFNDCKFYHYNNRPAVYMHNYPAGASYPCNVRFFDCLLYTTSDTAIRVDNARNRAGSAGNSYIVFTFRNCTAATSCNYVSLVLDANDDYVGYIPTSGEIVLSSDSMDNNIIGLNHESAGSTPYYDVVIFGDLHAGRYVGGVHLANQKDYDVTLYSLKTYDGDHEIASDTAMNLANDDLIVLICTNATYPTEIPSGAQAIFSLVPKKRPTLIP